MAHFLDLSPEVRAAIFEYCLVVGKIFPHLKRSVYKEKNLVHEAFGYEIPDIALMSVCRRFNREATPILYQQNTLTFGSAARSWAFFTKNLHNKSRLSWLKSIEIHITSFELSSSDRKAISEEENAKRTAEPHEPGHTPPTARYAIKSGSEHTRLSYQIHEAEIFWLLKQSRILHYPRLERLSVRLKNTPCRAPCCHPPHPPTTSSFSANFHPNVPQSLHLHHPTVTPVDTPRARARPRGASHRPLSGTSTSSRPPAPPPLDSAGLRRRFVDFWIAEEKAGRGIAEEEKGGRGIAEEKKAGRGPLADDDAEGASSSGRENALAVAKRTQKGMHGRWRNLG